MTVEAYRELERTSDVRHEYIDGYVYAMAGGTKGHGRIAVNVIAALAPHLGEGPCRVYNSDVKVRLSATRYVYPDVSVSCDERDNANDDEDEVRYPRLIVAVLSPSTEDYDRTDKFDYYRACASLQDYVLVNGRRSSVHVYSRGEHGRWIVQPFGSGDEVVFPALGIGLPVDQLYRAVRLPETPHDDAEASRS